ncbi:hypothetical protein [Mycobacteroides abscessus]|uniref:hypothetical protein n=1 Tax=Mycobacteroides abscessus TaxID=36809 RepID=UPI000C257F3D|nr:hypothetical protein [Mycobacteroides abscessus]PVB44277.1 hypothetical protein DDJ39_15055 [Mycobacteroides abscessus]
MTTLPRRRHPRPAQPQPLEPSGIRAPRVRAADQAELRDRRRKRQRVHYTGGFNLSAEVAAVCRSVAYEASRVPNPGALRRDVEAVADAVHEVLSTAVGMIAQDRHASTDARARTVQTIADLAVRPQAPDIADEQIVSGSWAATLATWVEPYSGDLAALLGRALPPDAVALKGSPSASERIERALRTLDGAVRDLERHVPKVRARQSLPSMAEFNRQLKAKADAERQQRALAKLGAV